jgi:predicted nucleic acid-binding Zn ribbon protein
MAKNKKPARRKWNWQQVIFLVISLMIVLAMVLSLITTL